MPHHKFKIGDKVIYTNSFGVCWGVKTIKSLETFPVTRNDNGPHIPAYHYEGSDTPWCPTQEDRFVPADAQDLEWAKDANRHDQRFQDKYGFTPTIEQLGGCY